MVAARSSHIRAARSAAVRARDATIVVRRKNGETYASIARDIGVSAMRIRQIVHTAELAERRGRGDDRPEDYADYHRLRGAIK